MKYELKISSGLAGCDRVVTELDSDDYMAAEEWNELPEDEQYNLLYDTAGELVMDYVEYFVRPINEDPH